MKSKSDENELFYSDYINVKHNFKNCLFINTSKQFIICNKDSEKKDNLEYFEIDDKFKIAIPKEELKSIENNFPNTSYLISPYFLLYKIFTLNLIENALWILNQEDFITLCVIKEETIIFGKQIKKDENFIVENFIKDTIKEFYKSECCYFLENIFIYDAAKSINDEDIKKIKESTLLDVKSNLIDLKDEIVKLCSNNEYIIDIEQKKDFVIPNIVKYSILSIFVLFLGVDLFFKYQNSNLESKLESLQNEKVFLEKNIKSLKKEISTLKLIVPVAQNIKSSNSLIKNKIKGLFELIPDPITLKRAEFDKNALILEGFTPQKRDYYKLESVLKSFYQTRDVKFQKVKNGYLFLSINKELEAKNAK